MKLYSLLILLLLAFVTVVLSQEDGEMEMDGVPSIVRRVPAVEEAYEEETQYEEEPVAEEEPVVEEEEEEVSGPLRFFISCIVHRLIHLFSAYKMYRWSRSQLWRSQLWWRRWRWFQRLK
jgi:hypothetical protein